MKIAENPRAQRQAQTSMPTESKYSVSLKPYINLPMSWNETTGRFVDIEEVGEVTIPFSIDIEAREWGIKGISLSVAPIQANVEIIVIDVKNSKEEKYVKTISFDTGSIKLWLEGGPAVTIKELQLTLNEDFSVNYEKSGFEGTTLLGSGE